MLESSKYFLEEVYPVSMSETDMKYRLKPAALFNFMQDLAAKSIDKIDHEFSCDELLRNGRGWFLIRYRVEFDDYPGNMNHVKVKTESRGVHRLNAYRDFECFNEQTGKCFLRATSSWFIVNIDNKSVINIQKEYPEFPLYEKRENDLELQKLKSIESFDFEKVFHVRYDDLDMNGHVNNTVYINWAMEALDFNFRNNYKLKTLDIYFKQEVKYGDDIISQVKIDKDNLITEHLIKNAKTSEEVCLLKAVFVAN